MPSDPSLSAPLLRLIESTVRGSAKNGITAPHLMGAIAEDSAQVARHVQALITEKKVIELPGQLFFTPPNVPV